MQNTNTPLEEFPAYEIPISLKSQFLSICSYSSQKGDMSYPLHQKVNLDKAEASKDYRKIMGSLE